MPDFDLHQWFDREELEPCPACGERTGIRLPSSHSLMCVACGYIAAADTVRAAADEPNGPGAPAQ